MKNMKILQLVISRAYQRERRPRPSLPPASEVRTPYVFAYSVPWCVIHNLHTNFQVSNRYLQLQQFVHCFAYTVRRTLRKGVLFLSLSFANKSIIRGVFNHKVCSPSLGLLWARMCFNRFWSIIFSCANITIFITGGWGSVTFDEVVNRCNKCYGFEH